MKNFKGILMAGLLISLFAASTSFAADAKDPNDAPVAGAQAVVPGAKCDVCQANTAGGGLKQDDPHRYDGLLPDGGTAADKAGTVDKGTK